MDVREAKQIGRQQAMLFAAIGAVVVALSLILLFSGWDTFSYVTWRTHHTLTIAVIVLFSIAYLSGPLAGKLILCDDLDALFLGMCTGVCVWIASAVLTLSIDILLILLKYEATITGNAKQFHFALILQSLAVGTIPAGILGLVMGSRIKTIGVRRTATNEKSPLD